MTTGTISTRIPTACIALLLMLTTSSVTAASYQRSGLQLDPYRYQIGQQLQRLASSKPADRAEAIENLTHLRAYPALASVLPLLNDRDATVRREATIYLGACGDRACLMPLQQRLLDPDLNVRQGAWVALCNLTGMDWPYDGTAAEDQRQEQSRRWREWLQGASSGLPDEIVALLTTPSSRDDAAWHRFERGARALAVFGTSSDVEPVLAMLTPYQQGEEIDEHSERLCVQACLRSFGRLGGTAATEALLGFLDHPQLAVYAADALGDIATDQVARALIRAFPKYAISVQGRLTWKRNSRYDNVVEVFHDDDAPTKSSYDRIPRTAYAIAHALARCALDGLQAELAGIAGPLLATLPSMMDATIFYEPSEPYPMLVAYLTERAGLRAAIVDLNLRAHGIERPDPSNITDPELRRLIAFDDKKQRGKQKNWHSMILPALCTDAADAEPLATLLEHDDHYTRIAAAKALIGLEARDMADHLHGLLAALPDDIEAGFNERFHREEFDVAAGRYKEAYIRALGKLGRPADHTASLGQLCISDRNNLDIRYAAAQALGDLGGEAALEILRTIEREHSYQSIRIVAREILVQHGVDTLPRQHTPPAQSIPQPQQQAIPQSREEVQAIVFLRGEHEVGNWRESPANMQAYTVTDGGPTYRLGRNIWRLEPPTPDGELTRVTNFSDGYIADLELTRDGQHLLFTRREADNPWWHLYRSDLDGNGLEQLTDGPYHDVHPEELGDGRLVFSTTRIGMRDEYHGYLCTGLAICNADGSDIHCIGMNLGRDTDPSVDADGRILFTRLELFYSRMKTEWNLLATSPSGTKTTTIYGPERREFWDTIPGGSVRNPPRHRIVRVSQPLPFGDAGGILLSTYAGPTIVGPDRNDEQVLQQDENWSHEQWAVTTPYPIGESSLLVAAGERPWQRDRKGNLKLFKGDKQRDFMDPVNHGLYWLDVASGELELIYDDPETSEFEARPVAPRSVPRVLPDDPRTRSGAYTASLFCQSVYNTRHDLVHQRGRYVRITEGLPTIHSIDLVVETLLSPTGVAMVTPARAPI
jgi:HEAT repeat protein